jgi:hypothetical protein
MFSRVIVGIFSWSQNGRMTSSTTWFAAIESLTLGGCHNQADAELIRANKAVIGRLGVGHPQGVFIFSSYY